MEFLGKTLILTVDIWHLDPKQTENKWVLNNHAKNRSYMPEGPVMWIPRCWSNFIGFWICSPCWLNVSELLMDILTHLSWLLGELAWSCFCKATLVSTDALTLIPVVAQQLYSLCGQQFYVQVEAVYKWCPSWVRLGTDTPQHLYQQHRW